MCDNAGVPTPGTGPNITLYQAAEKELIILYIFKEHLFPFTFSFIDNMAFSFKIIYLSS